MSVQVLLAGSLHASNCWTVGSTPGRDALVNVYALAPLVPPQRLKRKAGLLASAQARSCVALRRIRAARSGCVPMK